MNDQRAGFGQVDKSRACACETHSDCAHLVTLGGGLNPHRLRLEFGAALCPCTCHSPCPVVTAGKRLTVSPKAWQESCTCPGADPQRRRLDEAGIEFPDFSELREDALRRSRARKEAFESARAQAAGKSRDEIRAIYLAELKARNMPAPREDVLDAIIARITGNPVPAAHLAVKSLGQMAHALHDISRIFRPGS
jgi:hypothetical protein